VNPSAFFAGWGFWARTNAAAAIETAAASIATAPQEGRKLTRGGRRLRRDGGRPRRSAAPRQAAITTSGRSTAQLVVRIPNGKTFSTNAPSTSTIRLTPTLSVSRFGSANSLEPKATATIA
jgi:hypothetical protein